MVTKTYRTGSVGAMMDEYERASEELIRVLESLTDEAYERVRDLQTKDESCRSIQTIMRHVVGAGYGYAGMMRDAWGIPRVDPKHEPASRKDVPAKMRTMLAYTVETLEGKWNLSEDDQAAMRIQARWGPVYDFEQLFEHAIVHVLRHRRQIEKFLAA